MSKSYIARHAGLEVAFSAANRTYTHAAVFVKNGELHVAARFGRPDLVKDLGNGTVVVPVELGELSTAAKAAKLISLAVAAEKKADDYVARATYADEIAAAHPDRVRADGYVKLYDPTEGDYGLIDHPAQLRARAEKDRKLAAKYRREAAKLAPAAQ